MMIPQVCYRLHKVRRISELLVVWSGQRATTLTSSMEHHWIETLLQSLVAQSDQVWRHSAQGIRNYNNNSRIARVKAQNFSTRMMMIPLA